LIRVGCCGWPVARRRYVATFDLVEIQQTFYALPRLATAQRWPASVPDGFEFVLKAPQLITHEPTSPTYRRLRTPLGEAAHLRYGAFKPTAEVARVWQDTLALARALGSKIVLFQSPASFAPTAVHTQNLIRFFESVERDGIRFAWEPRGPWPDDDIRALCRRLDLIHCVDPFQREPLWGQPAYLRLHGRDGHRHSYSTADLFQLRDRVRSLEAAYVLFNNTPMYDDARRFLSALVEP
jgi:uncharacterized protein YecE (DUF72 family)